MGVILLLHPVTTVVRYVVYVFICNIVTNFLNLNNQTAKVIIIHCLLLEKSMEATAEDQENLADLEKRISTTYCIQTSDTTTITLSSASQTIRTDSHARTECQTIDGVFLSVNEYATLLEKASFSPNFRDDLAEIRSHIAHLT